MVDAIRLRLAFAGWKSVLSEVVKSRCVGHAVASVALHDSGEADIPLLGGRRSIEDQLNGPVHRDFAAITSVGSFEQRLRAEAEEHERSH